VRAVGAAPVHGDFNEGKTSMMHRRAPGALLLAMALVGALAGLPSCTGSGTNGGLVTETYTIGTFNLAAMGTDASESESFSISVPRPAGDIVMKKIRFFLLDPSGREMNLDDDGVHLHHVVMGSSKTTDSACPTSGYAALLGQRWSASGNEKTPIVLPDGYGYAAGAGDGWRAIWHLMNMGAGAVNGMRLSYEIAYVRGTAASAGVRDLTPYYLDVVGCTKSDFDLAGGAAAGTTTTKSATIPIPRAGRAVYTLGHLHDGGVDVSLVSPSGQARCTTVAQYGGGAGHEHSMPGMPAPSVQGHITAIPACPEPFDIGAGEAMTVNARYPGDAAFKDVMGVIFTYVAH
jgi:hypothetical protein